MKTVQGILLTFILLLLVAGCGSAAEPDEENTAKIYTTIYPLQFLVSEIAGDAVEALTVYPPGVDEHTYEPTAKELTAIAEGDAFLYIGAGLEAMAATAANALENQEVTMVEIGEHEELFLDGDEHHHGEEDHGGEDHHHHGDKDPHLWLDPSRMISIAAIIADELSSLYPENREVFYENLEELQKELETLDEAFQSLTDQKENKKILVTHAAFGYWEERYGIEQIAIHGLSTENEPSQKDLIEIIDTAEAHGLEHIIFEQNVTTRVAQVIQEELGAKPLIIHNLAVLTDEDISAGRDYLSIMRDNLNVLDEAMD